MSQLRNLLERIDQGGAPSLGFGATQANRLPAMALIARCSGDLGAAVTAATGSADAVVVASSNVTPDRLPELGANPWGVGGLPLTPDNVALWQATGADFMVSPLAGAVVDAIDYANPGMTHGARIPDDADDTTWRVLAAAPLDFLVLDKSAMTGAWTFADLGQASEAVGRTDKYLVLRVGVRPTANELLAFHQAGVVGIVAEANQLGADGLAGLKSDLLTLPRIQPTGRRRSRPTLDNPPP